MSNQPPPPPPPPPPRPRPHPVNPSRPRYLKRVVAGVALVLAVSIVLTPAHLGATPYPYTTALVMFGLYLAVSLMQRRLVSRSPGRAPAATPPAAGVTTPER